MKTRTSQFQNFTASFPADLKAFVKRHLAGRDLTVSQYMRRLIKSDLKALENPESDVIIQ